MLDFLKLLRLFILVLFAAILFSCDGGGGGGGAATTGTSPSGGTGDLDIPAIGSTSSVTVTEGTNSYGINTLWHTGMSTPPYETVANVFSGERMELEDGEELYIYFGDTNIYYFFYDNDDAHWYCCTETYTYNSATNTYTTASGDRGRLIIDGTTAQLLLQQDDGIDLHKMEASSSFNQTVTVFEMGGDDLDIDDTIVAPTINSLTATYSGGSVTINYNITAPSAVTGIYFRLWSPTIITKYQVSEAYYEDCAVEGQSFDTGETPDTGNGTTSVSGSMTVSLPGAEHGEWRIAEVWLDDGGDGLSMTHEADGDLYSSYYYHDENSDAYKATGFSVVTFTVSDGTADTTAPTMTGASISGTDLTITASGTPNNVWVSCIVDNHYKEEEGVDSYSVPLTTADGGTTWTADMSGIAGGVGDYYIYQIIVQDAAHNSSLYYGYDNDIDFWASDYADWSTFGIDLTHYNLYNGNELPTATNVSLVTFTKL